MRSGFVVLVMRSGFVVLVIVVIVKRSKVGPAMCSLAYSFFFFFFFFTPRRPLCVSAACSAAIYDVCVGRAEAACALLQSATCVDVECR